MSPEQVEGREADARSDIWALGVVIYEMATGTRPFEGDSGAGIIGAILKDTPAAISSRQPLSPPALDHIVDRCLDKDPDERWQNAGDIKRELTWAAQGQRRSPGSCYRCHATRKLPRLGLERRFGHRARRHRALRRTNWLSATPVPSAVRLTVSPSDNTTFIGSGASVPTTQFAVSPDGRHLAFIAAAIGGRPMVWVRSLDTLEARVLPGTEDAAYPFWSPDSRFLGFLAQGKLKKTDLLGGLPQALCDASSSDPRGATWNRDGIILFAPSSASGLLQVSAGGGSPTMALPLHDGDMSYRWPSFLSDGRHFCSTPVARASGVACTSGRLAVRRRRACSTPDLTALYASGYLLTVREGSLLAYPFDEKRLQLTGDPLKVAENVGGTSTSWPRSPSRPRPGALTGPHHFQPADVVRP